MLRAFVVGKSKTKQKKEISKPYSAKSQTSDVSHRDDVTSPFPSNTSAVASSDHSDNAENQILSSENSALGESISSLPEKDSSDSAGFEVHVRIKPLEDQDADGASSNRLRCVQVQGKQDLVLCTRPSLKKENTANNHWFKFDHVLDEGASQKDTYDVTTQPLVEKALQGYHSCLIAYGSPGSGKSHALFGKASSGKYKGLIIRAAETMKASVDKSEASETKVEVSMSFVQIYNEKLYDILDPSATDNIKFHDIGDIHSLEGVTEWPVETTEDVTKQLRRNPNRLRDSGRSHTIFTLLYRREEVFEQDEEAATKNFRTIAGRLDFVDLAGVNRPTKHSTQDSTGTAKANRSLQVFSNVVWTLTDSKSSQSPPYKDSRLTRMLREALGGNCVTNLLVTASSCPNSAHETLNCLSFAKRALSVKNFPAPYVSVEKIKEKHNEETPIDEKVPYVRTATTIESECSNITTAEQHSKSSGSHVTDSTIEPSNAFSSSEDASAATLPPIKIKTATCSNSSIVSEDAGTNQHKPAAVAKEVSNPHLKEAKVENEMATQKLSRRRRASKDYLDRETSEEKRRNDKSRRSKRKSKNRSQDSGPSSQVNWPTDQDQPNPGNVVTLPQIDTPDLIRHQGFSNTDSTTQDGKNRRKKQTDVAATREFELLKSIKERPSSSHAQGSSRDEGSSSISGGNKLDLSERKEAFTGVASASHEQLFKLSLEASSCCHTCREREDKIKRDYDRMILFSKKDRDMKQSRIEELEVLLSKIRKESAPVAEIQKLTEEKVKDHQVLKKQKELIESLRAQLASMIGATEWKHLQDLHQKDSIEMEKLKKEMVALEKDLDDQTVGASKMLAKKSEQIAECETEVAILRQKVSKLNMVSKSDFDQLQAAYDQVNEEKEQTTSKHLTMMKEISFKLTCAQAQISQLQEAKVEADKEHEKDKENCTREISLLNQKVVELSKSKKKQEILKNLPLKCDSSTNTEDLKTKLNGLAYTVHCLRCAAQNFIEDNDREESPSLQDAELSILLLQDTKNRELLLQLKRERNLLRDVMKIMYCRQWFTKEGNPHVKRTLRKVGIDLRELASIERQ